MATDPAYRNRAKNRWRVDGWSRHKRAVQSVGIRPADAVCVYLPGPPEDGNPEAHLAIRKGFRRENLIGIEWDRERAREHRRRGWNVICGDAREVIASWPSHTPISVVSLDLMSTAGRYTSDYGWLLIDRPFVTGASIVVNVCRGRDPHNMEVVGDAVKGCLPRGLARHRGVVWMINVARALAALSADQGLGMDQGEITHRFEQLVLRQPKGGPTWMSNVAYSSYQSNRIVMDGVWFQRGRAGIYDDDRTLMPHTRTIAAALAHRTMGTYSHGRRVA